MTKYSIILLIFTLFFTACGQRTGEKINLDDVEIARVQISSETMTDIVQNIASPMEVSTLISSLQIPFSTSNLPNPEDMLTDADPLEMAFHLGMLYTDLGYLHMYEKTDMAESYLKSIDTLTTSLNIDRYFDIATIKRLASSSSMDSLLYVSINSFNYMGNSLRESDHGEESALMICGAWLEGLYMATQTIQHNDSKHLRNMIGDQKLILNDLLLVLNYYNSDSLMTNYIADLEKILTLYDEVEIISAVGDPEAVEKDGMLELVQSESSVLKMSDEVLREITEMTAEVRNLHLRSVGVNGEDVSGEGVSSESVSDERSISASESIASVSDEGVSGERVNNAHLAMKTQAK